jgi:hypothetical protein
MLKDASRERIVVPPAHCASLVAKLAAAGYGESFPTLFKRGLHRWAIQAPATIRYAAASGAPVEAEAQVTDLSAAGIGLLSKEPVAAGTQAEVFVLVRDFTYSGRVRILHSTSTAAGVRIGCEFIVREGPGSGG